MRSAGWHLVKPKSFSRFTHSRDETLLSPTPLFSPLALQQPSAKASFCLPSYIVDVRSPTPRRSLITNAPNIRRCSAAAHLGTCHTLRARAATSMRQHPGAADRCAACWERVRVPLKRPLVMVSPSRLRLNLIGEGTECGTRFLRGSSPLREPHYSLARMSS